MAKFRRQVQTWAVSDENGPHAAQTPKPTLQNVVFRLFYQKERKGKKQFQDQQRSRSTKKKDKRLVFVLVHRSATNVRSQLFATMIPTRCNQLSARECGIVVIIIARMRRKTPALWNLACHVVQLTCKLVKCQHVLNWNFWRQNKEFLKKNVNMLLLFELSFKIWIFETVGFVFTENFFVQHC